MDAAGRIAQLRPAWWVEVAHLEPEEAFVEAGNRSDIGAVDGHADPANGGRAHADQSSRNRTREREFGDPVGGRNVHTLRRCTSNSWPSSSTITTLRSGSSSTRWASTSSKTRLAVTNDGRPKRWVTVRPPGAATGILLARADGETQAVAVGNQFAGRVGLFLRVDDFDITYERMAAAGVEFVTEPRTEPYGRVAVFLDIAGNRWDLLGTR